MWSEGKDPEIGERRFGFTSSAPVDFGQGFFFLTKNKVMTLEYPPYSADLTAVDFYLFPRLKSALKGRRYCDATDIIKNATAELKRLSQNVSTFTVAVRSVFLHNGAILKEI